jgi:redox-sensitive bicupin YhaK (pirin superfamily)
LRLIASPDGRDDSVMIHQDTSLYAALLEKGQEVVHELNANRHAWVQVARGAVSLNGQLLSQGDGAAVSDEQALALVGQESAEVLVFDLA